MTSRAGLAAALLTILVTGSLAGCGGDSSGGGAASADAPKGGGGPAETWPFCDEIWVTGETLPRTYQGCVLQGNTVKPFSPEECASGSYYATYEDRWYAVPGDKIQESKAGDIFSDPAFARFKASC